MQKPRPVWTNCDATRKLFDILRELLPESGRNLIDIFFNKWRLVYSAVNWPGEYKTRRVFFRKILWTVVRLFDSENRIVEVGWDEPAFTSRDVKCETDTDICARYSDYDPFVCENPFRQMGRVSNSDRVQTKTAVSPLSISVLHTTQQFPIQIYNQLLSRFLNSHSSGPLKLGFHKNVTAGDVPVSQRWIVPGHLLNCTRPPISNVTITRNSNLNPDSTTVG